MKTTKIQIPDSVKRFMNAMGDVYLVGGSVRDILMDRGARDFDFATPMTPEEVRDRAAVNDFKVHDTGLQHGTVTVSSKYGAFEVTTFRKDVDTDGRHATVNFVTNIQEDAERRDFTVNALYAKVDGVVVDPTGEGLSDIKSRRIRFVGSADARCKEDFLRILRLFRFHAQFGEGTMDSMALEAVKTNATGLDTISRERIWAEMRKLMDNNDPFNALQEMARQGILSRIFPFVNLVEMMQLRKVEKYTPMLMHWAIRFLVMTQDGALTTDLPLSNDDKKILHHGVLARTALLGGATLAVVANTFGMSAAYVGYVTSLLDGRPRDEFPVHNAIKGSVAIMPLRGEDLINKGWKPGPAIGVALERAMTQWRSSDFVSTKDELLKELLEERKS